MNRLLAGSVIIALLVMSGVSALADESVYEPIPEVVGESYEEVGDNDNFGEGDDLPSLCSVLQGNSLCCNSPEHDLGLDELDSDGLDSYELDFGTTDIIEVETDGDISIYEALSFLYLYEQVIHTPMEQNIALGFVKEELVITSAVLHVRSLNTDEEFTLPASKIVENLALFSVYYGEGSPEDEMFIESIKYTIEGQEEPFLVLFYHQGIEASYVVTNKPIYDTEEAGITIYGIGNDGEVFAEHTTVEAMTETIEDILDIVDGSVHLSEPILEEEWDNLLEDLLIEGSEAQEPFMEFSPASGTLLEASVAPFNSNRIIAVSAGHCSTHVGAYANGLHEYRLTWHVANVVRDELNRFAGITAILDRPTINCRYFPGVWTTAASNHCLTQRIRDARAAGATVFVDIHFNSGPPSAHGAEVWIPNNRTNDGRHQEGLRVGNAILENLARLGITNRGCRTRDNDHGGDWLATNRIARELGMTGILVEGGFLTNTAEANRLRDPNFRQNLGVQIARGIAAAYGASLPEAPPQQLTSTTAATSVNNQDIFFDLRVNFNTDQWVSRVQFEVWGEVNGQNDVRWYEGTRQGNNSWTGRADIRNHRETGRYQVRTWVTLTNGTRFNTSSTTFNVRAATGGTAQVLNNNPGAGTFDVVVSGINSVSGINEVRIAVWSQEGQRDLVWYPGVRQSNGSHRATVNLANHSFNLGTYHIHAWITTGNGQSFAVTTRHNVTSRPQLTVTATNRNGTEIFYDLRASNVAILGTMQQVQFAVWSNRNGQNDLIWYEGSRQANGSWTAAADVRRHRYTGMYHVHVWGTRTDGSRVFIGGTTFHVTPPSGPNPQVVNNNPSAGTFDVVVSGIRSVSGINDVRVAVWSQEGQRDLVWYTGVRQNDGSHRVTVHLANHNFNLGTYYIHAWLTTGNGQSFAVTTRHHVTSRPQTTVTATRRAGSENLFDMRMINAAIFGNMQRVQFAVWSERNGQNDLIWYDGSRQANGSWTATADTRRHRYPGRYHVHVWGDRADGSRIFMGGTTFNVASLTEGLTPIMGNSQTNVAQMVRNYRNTGHTFPEAALGMSLNDFAQLVLDEANREGVRGEVLWAQVMRETGWLQFGGCVRINQFNFGGLGATGGGNPGHSFPTVQIGLRAQVHHLVAYATTASVRHPSNRAHPVMRTEAPWGPTGQTVVNGTESPRFHFVSRGISPYVNWLGQGENPNHPGFWAADRNYGASLAQAIRVLLNS